MTTLTARLNRFIDTRITQVEPHIVGRFGLYRIMYALFYLWIIARYNYPELSLIPDGEWLPVITLSWMNGAPPISIIQGFEFLLVAGLIFVLFGFRTQAATLTVLFTGIFLAGLRYSFGKIDHYDHFMFAFIPAIMFFYDWGKTHSVDALLRMRQGKATPDPKTSNWQDAWPLLMILVILVVLFTTAGILKALPDRSSWLWHTDIIRKLTHHFNQGYTPNPLAPFIVDNALVYGPLRFLALGFECFFFLALFNRKLRTFFIASAWLFHVYNLVFMGIVFLEMLIVYAIFIDWQGLYMRYWPQALNAGRALQRVPSAALMVSIPIVAAVISATWVISFHSLPREVLRLIPLQLGWIIGTVVALGCLAFASYGILQDILAYLSKQRRAGQPDARTA